MNRFDFQLLNMDELLPPLVKDFLYHPEKLESCFHYKPAADSFREAMDWKRKNFPHRNLLAEQLKKQYEHVTGDKAKALLQIEKLKSENTFTITTGHQLNIFTGPLYFIYKVVSVIRLSEMLKKKFPEAEFVPVYWMVSEDHDLAEINHFYFKGEKIVWNQHQPGMPCGRLSTEGLPEIAERLLQKSEDHAALKKFISLFRESYSSHTTLASAMRDVVHRLFGNKGLVIIDGDDMLLKTVLQPVMLDEAENQTAFRLVNKTIESLEKNYKVQVHPREINFFYLGEGVRERITSEDSGFTTLQTGRRFSREELKKEIETHPGHFSPNVITRPLFQEMILPDIVYTGGPAEISYWLEYKTFFEYHAQRMPVLLLRDSFLWLDLHVAQLIEKTGLKTGDFLLEENAVIRKLLEQAGHSQTKIESEVQEIEKAYENLMHKISSADATLAGSVMAEKQKALKGIQHLEEKLRKALKKKEEVNINRIHKIREAVFPEGTLQERRENLLFAAEKFGEDFIELLLTKANPFENGLKTFIAKPNN